jgi:hypothetical protein
VVRNRLRRELVRVVRGARPLRRIIACLSRRVGPPRGIHLGWAADPTEGIAVDWSSAARGARSGLELRPVGETTWRRFEADVRPAPAPRGLLHRVEVHGLVPGSTYEYRVSNDVRQARGWSGVHRTRTPPTGAAASCRVAFFADSAVHGRRDGRSAAVLRMIKELAADDVLVLLGGGDYTYAASDDRFVDPADAIDAWFEQMEPLFTRSIFLPTFGNHEVALGEWYEDWAPRFRLPRTTGTARSYSFDLGGAHLVSLYAPGLAPDDADLEWLERDLGTARQRGARWLIVYQHAPIFAHGTSHPALQEVRDRVLPVLERAGVDLHLSAHDQSYERTPPLHDLGSTAGAPVEPGGHAYAAGSGVVYAKVSPFGKRSDRGGDFSRLRSPAPAWIAARNDDCHHYALLDIGPSRLEVEVVGVPEDGGGRRTIDRFVIERE